MAPTYDDRMLNNRCEFIPAEINHDFDKNPPLIDEYQKDCWEKNSICTNNDLNGANPLSLVAPYSSSRRRRGADGDADLVSQVFRKPNSLDPWGAGYSKSDLKKMSAGYDISMNCMLRSLNLDLSTQLWLYGPGNPLQNSPMSNKAFLAEKGTCDMIRIEVTKPGTDFQIYKVFKYPDENFLFIDARPAFVTSTLKKIQFPPVPNNNTGMAGGIKVASPFSPEDYSNSTIDQLNGYSFFNVLGIQYWPYRPKINVVFTPNTLADPATVGKRPGEIKYNIDSKLPPNVLLNNYGYIPGTNATGGVSPNSVPLIFTWFYNKAEVSVPDNALIMSRYKITTKINGNPKFFDKLIMQQFWQNSDPDPNAKPRFWGTDTVTGLPIDPNIANNIKNLKDEMIINGIITPPSQKINTSKESTASLYVQRKRYGDYGAIKSAYEFPSNAERYGTDNYIYRLYQGPYHALYNPHPAGSSPPINTQTNLAGSGHLKGSPSSIIKNKKWYKDRTYFVTGDWPAFCAATYNRINCILICEGTACREGATDNMLFRCWFP